MAKLDGSEPAKGEAEDFMEILRLSEGLRAGLLLWDRVLDVGKGREFFRWEIVPDKPGESNEQGPPQKPETWRDRPPLL